MNRPLSFTAARVWSTAVLIVVAGAATAVLAQAPSAGATPDGAAPPKGCAMMAQHNEQATAAEQKLAELVARMNAATGAAKVDAIAAVVAELAAQRMPMKKMQGSMMKEAPPPQPATTATEADHTGHHPEK